MSMKFQISDYSRRDFLRLMILLPIEIMVMILIAMTMASRDLAELWTLVKDAWWVFLIGTGFGVWIIYKEVSHSSIEISDESIICTRKKRLTIPLSKITGFSVNTYPWVFKDQNGERVVAIIADRRFDFLWKPKIIKFTGKKQGLELLKELQLQTGKPIYRRNIWMIRRSLKD